MAMNIASSPSIHCSHSLAMSGPSLSLKVGYGGNPCGVLIVEELMLTELVGTVGADVVVGDEMGEVEVDVDEFAETADVVVLAGDNVEVASDVVEVVDVVVVDDCFDCGVSPCDILLAASFSAVNTKFSLTQ